MDQSENPKYLRTEEYVRVQTHKSKSIISSPPLYLLLPVFSRLIGPTLTILDQWLCLPHLACFMLASPSKYLRSGQKMRRTWWENNIFPLSLFLSSLSPLSLSPLFLHSLSLPLSPSLLLSLPLPLSLLSLSPLTHSLSSLSPPCKMMYSLKFVSSCS